MCLARLNSLQCETFIGACRRELTKIISLATTSTSLRVLETSHKSDTFLSHSFDHLSFDQKMTLIGNCIQQYLYSVGFLNTLLEYAHQVFERAELNRNSVSILEFFTELNEPVFIYLLLDEIYDSVVYRNRTIIKADYFLNASCVIDIMKLLAGVKAGKDITCK